MFAGTSAPTGWLLCQGQAVSRTTYVTLWEIIGTTYGVGNGSTTFNLPDLRGRTAIGAGQGPGLTNRNLGVTVGAETHTLTVSQMPVHNHGMSKTNAYGLWQDRDVANGSGSAWATGNQGGNGSHNNMQPSISLSFIIKL